MSANYNEQMSLDLKGSAVDGTAKKGLDDTGAGVQSLTEDLKKIVSTGATDALQSIRQELEKLAIATVGMAAIKALTTEVFEATKKQEDMVITIAATMSATNGWAKSTEIATNVLVKLKETAALVGTSTDQVVQTFTLLKRTFGGTSDEAVTLTGKLALLARQSGASIDELASRLASASITGMIMPRGAAGIALTGAGIDPNTLMLMKDAGLALEYLNATIADNPALVDKLKESWSYLGAEFTKSKTEAMEAVGQGFEPLKKVLKEMSDNLDSLDAKRKFGEIAQGLSAFSTYMASLDNDASIHAPIYIVWLEKLGQGFEAFIVRVTAGWQTYSAVTRGIAQHLIDQPGLDAMDLLSGKNPFGDLDKQIESIRKKANDAIAEIMHLPTAVDLSVHLAASHASAMAAGAVGSVSTAGGGPEAPTDPGGDRIKKAKELAAQMAILTQDTWDQVNAYNETGLKKQLDLVEAETNKEIAALQTKGATAKQVADATAAYEALGDAKKRALIDADETKRAAKAAKDQKDALLNADWLVGEQSKLSAELAAVSDDYYAKQAASIDKSVQKEAESIDKRLDEGKLTQTQHDALIAQLATLDAAETAHLAQEQNSIIGFRKTMEENAALLVKTTDSWVGGIQAGIATIAASAKSLTESTRDFVVGTFNAFTTGLDTALQRLESGTGSFKDAWKSMLDSMLKSLNTMVEEMVKKWLIGTKEMGKGGLDSLFGGTTQKPALDAQGKIDPNARDIYGQPDRYGWSATGGGSRPVPANISTGSAIGMGGLAALGVISSISGPDTLLGGGVAQAGISLGMLAAQIIPVIGAIVGVIIAAIGVIVQALLPRQAEFAATYMGSYMLDAIQSGVASGPAGSDREKATTAALTIKNSMTGFFADMFKDVDPSVRAGILDDLNTKVRAYFESLGTFGAHAGSGSDFMADITKIFEQVLPKQIMHAMFGQTTNFLADPGGITGTGLAPGGKWGPVSSFSGVDEKSPLVSFLTGIGFSIAKVNEIAGQIDVRSEEDFQKYFAGLVGIVLSAKTLGDTLKQTYQETLDANAKIVAQSPAEGLAAGAANVTELLKEVSDYSGDEQITKAKDAITAAQTFYDTAKTAMLQLAALAQTITQEGSDSLKKIGDSLKTPAQLFAQSSADLQADYERMRFAANPTDLQAGWEKARTDFEAMASDMVSRIKSIQSLLDDIHTLQDAMSSGPGADATTDPTLWLQQNTAAMQKYQEAMTKATPGSPEEIAAATSLAGLIRDRYTMEMDLLGRVKSTIESINQSIDQQLFGIQLDEAKTPGAKADLLHGQMEKLYEQLQTAQTPEDVQKFTSQIQGLATQLLALSPAGSASHATDVAYVEHILELVRQAANTNLNAQGTAAQVDIATLGPKLADAETRMEAALAGVQQDLTDLEWHFGRAEQFATDKLNEWGVQIADQLGLIDPVLTAMTKNFTDVNTALTGTGTTGPGGGTGDSPGLTPAIADATIAVGDFAAALRKGTTPAAANSSSAPAAGTPIHVSASVTVNQNGDVDLDAMWDAFVPSLQVAFEKNNIRVAKALRRTQG